MINRIKAFFINKIIIYSIKKLLGKEEVLKIAHQMIGVLNYGDESVTGEMYVIKEILPQHLQKENLTIFDVGANVGNYSHLLEMNFNKSIIYAFEPNKKAYQEIKNNCKSERVKYYNLGVGSSVGKNHLFSFSELEATELGTCNEEALKSLFGESKKDSIEKIDFDMTSIDSFCKENEINKIDFLKIDVEGYELEVIKGAKNMIDAGNISIIQFEFN